MTLTTTKLSIVGISKMSLRMTLGMIKLNKMTLNKMTPLNKMTLNNVTQHNGTKNNDPKMTPSTFHMMTFSI